MMPCISTASSVRIEKYLSPESIMTGQASSSGRPSPFTTLAAAGLGVILGAAVVALAVRRTLPNTHTPAETPPSAGTPADLPTSYDPRVDDLARRVAAFESRAKSAPSVVPAMSGSPAEMPAPSDAETRAREAREEMIKRFASEGTDRGWAPRASVSFQRDLKELGATLGVTADNVTCHTTMCSAELEGSSFEAVARSAKSFVQAKYSMNCSKTLFFPPPDDPEAAYRTTLYFDCEKIREESP
jgi:hypothetical protein